jgi:hypothetical protein
MLMATTEIVPVSDDELRASPHYQRLLASCLTICEKARISVLHYMWKLGERIRSACPLDRDETYGKQIILNLERDLAIDRTTLIRARQTYDKFHLEDIGDGSSPMLTWGKLRMLLPLEDAEMHYFLDRIRSGELRTDDDLRTAIALYEVENGTRPPSPLGDAAPGIFGIKGLHAEKLQTLWRRAAPPDRAAVVAVLIPHLGLDHCDRTSALKGIREIESALAEYKKRINRGPSDD